VALVALAPVVAVLTVGAEPSAQAATSGNYLVTFVARSCPNYTDITANLARNNIQESLQDLGGDTLYTSGQPISPTIEEQGQPLDNPCVPLDNWQFTFGNGIGAKNTQYNLSTVSSPGSPITVQNSVPLLDPQGNATGQSIQAATTVTLTQNQVNAAMSHNLWVQGGTPTDPLLNTPFPRAYAFGALRCAVDNLNGDNVEWVGFPSGQTHVFCYYYAVSQAPTSGTIVIQKQLAVPESATNTFPFAGNVSYNPPPGATDPPQNSPFQVSVAGTGPGSTSFVRSANLVGPGAPAPWDFRELATTGFDPPVAPVCHGTNVSPQPVSVITQPDPTFPSDPTSVSVRLAPGDTVTCLYTNTRITTGSLTVLKQTSGGVGGPFGITVTGPPTPPSQVPTVTPLTVSTSEPDVPVAAQDAGGHTTISDAVQGGYQLVEDIGTANSPGNVAANGGTWTVSGFGCDDGVTTYPQTDPIQNVTVTAGESLVCTFTNLFHPVGSLTITKTTTGGVGSTDFVVTPIPNPANPDDQTDPTPLLLGATTIQPGVPSTASGDSLSALPVGTAQYPQKYLVDEEGPLDSSSGTWSPQAIACDNGVSVAAGTAEVEIQLSPATPDVTCAFTNAFTATPPATTTTTTPPTTTTTSTVPGGVAANDTGQSGGALAMTGEDVRLPLGIAGGLALVGVMLLLVDRVRRRTVPVGVDRRDEPPQG